MSKISDGVTPTNVETLGSLPAVTSSPPSPPKSAHKPVTWMYHDTCRFVKSVTYRFEHVRWVRKDGKVPTFPPVDLDGGPQQ